MHYNDEYPLFSRGYSSSYIVVNYLTENNTLEQR